MPIIAATAEINELVEMIGRARVSVLLDRFRHELEASPQSASTTASTTAATKDIAHRIVSQAGMLGFHALSMAARGLEAALATNADVGAALAAFSTQRDEVLRQLPAIVAALMSDPASHETRPAPERSIHERT